jgi:hypothetical protein
MNIHNKTAGKTVPDHSSHITPPSSSSDKPFICPECGTGVTAKGNLVQHIGSRKCIELVASRGHVDAVDLTNEDGLLNKSPELVQTIFNDNNRKKAPSSKFPSSSSSSSFSSDESDESNNDGDDDAMDVDAAEDATVDLLVDMNVKVTAFLEALAYDKKATNIKRQRNANKEIIEATRQRSVIAFHVAEAAEKCLQESQPTFNDATTMVTRTHEAISLKREALSLATHTLGEKMNQHTKLAQVNVALQQTLNETVTLFKQSLPHGIDLTVIGINAHYSDEMGMVDGARIDAFIDRVNPTLRDELANARTEVDKVDQDIHELISIEAAAMNAEREASNNLDKARSDFDTKRGHVTAIGVLLDRLFMEDNALNARIQTEFMDAEKNNTGAFASLSVPARDMVRAMRNDRTAVKIVGRKVIHAARLLPKVLIVDTPFVLNDEVLDRKDDTHVLPGEFAGCKLCPLPFPNEPGERMNAVLRTPCNHFFHAACINEVFAKDSINYENIYHQDKTASIPCPECSAPVSNTSFTFVSDESFYYF